MTRPNRYVGSVEADLDPNRPQPTPWSSYVTWLDAEWSKLLNSDPPELEIHKFLEQNPVLLPGVNEFGGGHHPPAGRLLFSELELQGVRKNRRPDFVWITATSAAVRPVFIEIERPGKRFFDSKGNFTPAFSNAHDQLSQWSTWWESGPNRTWFKDQVLDPIGNYRQRAIEPRYILIYGRRSELDADPTGDLNHRRAGKKKPAEEIMTFDRLWPNESLRDMATVKQRENGQLSLCGLPASFTAGPDMAPLAARIHNPPIDVFNAVPHWSSERAKYVRDRWLHWGEVKRRAAGSGNGFTMHGMHRGE